MLSLVREAFSVEAVPIKGKLSLLRLVDCGKEIGFDRQGLSTTMLSIISDTGGKIITAFPGRYSDADGV